MTLPIALSPLPLGIALEGLSRFRAVQSQGRLLLRSHLNPIPPYANPVSFSFPARVDASKEVEHFVTCLLGYLVICKVPGQVFYPLFYWAVFPVDLQVFFLYSGYKPFVEYICHIYSELDILRMPQQS